MIKKKKEKSITLDELARMVKNGFVASDENLHREIGGLRKEINDRFDRLEKFTLDDHQRRIHYLEVEVKHLKDIFALK